MTGQIENNWTCPLCFLQPGGSIRLVNPADYAKVAHQRVIDAVGGFVQQTTVDGVTTTVITVPR